MGMVIHEDIGIDDELTFFLISLQAINIVRTIKGVLRDILLAVDTGE